MCLGHCTYMEKRDERCGESDFFPLSLRPIGDLPKEIKVKSREGSVFVSEGDGVSAWTKARI